MKRILAAILFVGLLCTSSVAKAYDKEILFRDIPWLLDAETYINTAAPWTEQLGDLNEGISGSITEDYVWVDTNEYLQFGTGGESSMHGGLDIMVTLPEHWTVAGYDVDVFGVNALLGVVDGEYSENPKDAITVQATYSFDMNAIQDIVAMRDDLIEKLTSVYGTGEEFDSVWTRNVTWRGENNTYVMLVAKLNFSKDGGPEYDTLWIDYGRSDIDDLFFATQAELDRDMDSTDGL